METVVSVISVYSIQVYPQTVFISSNKRGWKLIVCGCGCFEGFCDNFCVDFYALLCKIQWSKLHHQNLRKPPKIGWKFSQLMVSFVLGGGRRNVHSARPGKCQKSYTSKIVRNQFGMQTSRAFQYVLEGGDFV